jgi:hypothetical protein
MVEVSVQHSGEQAWRDALSLMAIRVDRATARATTTAVRLVERSTRVYLLTYQHPPGTPTPAPPGGPPARVSGDLVRSMHSERTRFIRRAVYSGETGPRTAYGRIQELGGHAGRNHRVRLSARPYLKPRTRAELVRITFTYRDAWAEATRT